jgi:hypothetical protein
VSKSNLQKYVFKFLGLVHCTIEIWGQFFKKPVRAYARSWRLCATLRRCQLFRRRENLFKKLASEVLM